MTLTAYTKVTYRVPDGVTSVRLRYALDSTAAAGSAVVRVMAGDRKIHEGSATTTSSPEVNAALEGASTVTIEIAHGATAGALARVNILEPLLLK